MPLLDHFHPPLHPVRRWESFHARLAGSVMDALNRILPRRFFAEVQVHLGRHIEADVAEFEQPFRPEDVLGNGEPGGVAVQTYAPPAPPLTFTAVLSDDVEVRVYDDEADARLVAVVELVSPGNKDREEARQAFVGKCAAYLQKGVGLIILDIVTSRHANLHDELMELYGLADPYVMGPEAILYAVAYRPVRRGEVNQVDVWPERLAVGGTLPQLPLALKGHSPIPLNLEAAYTDAREHCRL